MTEKERNALLKAIEKKRAEIQKDPEVGRQFLIDVGVITEKGNLRKPYKHLCIRVDQD